MLWLELLIRSAAVYVAVLFLPLAIATLVWPAVSHWCRRLVETLAALILSKFVIVAVLSLAAGALSSGTAGTGVHGAGLLLGPRRRRAAPHGHVRPLRHPAHDPRRRGRGGRPPRGAPRHAPPGPSLGPPGARRRSRSTRASVRAGDARLMAASSFGVHRRRRWSRRAAGGGGRVAGTRAKGAAPVGVTPDTKPDDVVGPNGETYQELLDQVTPENGGLIADAAGRFIGDPNSQRVFDEAMAEGDTRRRARTEAGHEAERPRPVPAAHVVIAPPDRPGATRGRVEVAGHAAGLQLRRTGGARPDPLLPRHGRPRAGRTVVAAGLAPGPPGRRKEDP